MKLDTDVQLLCPQMCITAADMIIWNAHLFANHLLLQMELRCSQRTDEIHSDEQDCSLAILKQTTCHGKL